MSYVYAVSDLLESKIRLFPDKLSTHILQEFYNNQIVPYQYTYELSNNEIIRLIFEKDQFCHLVGLHYFGYEGVNGWCKLNTSPVMISQLRGINKRKREEIRITNFHKIGCILTNPNIYLYKNNTLNYKSDYFAIYSDSKRYYKLGIGTMSNGNNYGETFLVSLINSNDNVEVEPKNLLAITNKYITQKKSLD